MTTDDIIQEILQREGGYVDRGADRGGPTKFGVTQDTLARWRGHPVTPADVQGLEEPEATAILTDLYVKRPGFDRITSPTLRALVVDLGVNSGPEEATRQLQRPLGLVPDGEFGPATEGAVNRTDPAALYRKVCAGRVRLYGELVSRDPELARAKAAGFNLQAENAGGWAARVAEFIEGGTT